METTPKKILLVGLPNAFLENQRSVPRIGLLYLGTVLQQAGHEVSVEQLQSLRQLEDLIQNAYDMVGASATTREYPDAVQLLNYFKREGHQAKIIIGGPHATALPDECLLNGFDWVVTGEADECINDIVTHPPTTRRVDAGMVVELDRLPFPDRRLAGEPELWHPFMARGKENVLTTSMLLSRGCPYHCGFCGPHFSYRRRSDQNIGDELEMLCESGYRGLVIIDDLPFVTEQHVRGFCERIAPLEMIFRCNFRADLLTSSIAKMLAAVGCCRLQFGIESANSEVLARANKARDTKIDGHVIDICHEYGIEAKAMFVWGLPGDDSETAKEVIRWIERYRPDSVQISRFVPLPMSPFWREGYHRCVTNYRSLSFFKESHSSRTETPQANPRLQKTEVLYEKILSECSRLTHIDTGIPGLS